VASAAALAADADAAVTAEKAKIAADAASKIIANNMAKDNVANMLSKNPMRNTRYGCNLYEGNEDEKNSMDDISGTGPDCACQDSMPERIDY
jgi:hypothetical protein